ncbi:MAG TPA: NrfD/PsrC family molybdoenzyme membrane anchor subunit [Egibacteraceae bacterium]|nr:NrfD/PsrC family molybdoenzyme membrane anchor subunit [Egibacteraceae bacterium]
MPTPSVDLGAGAPAQQLKSPRGAMVPPAEVRSYHGRPILQAPAWTWEVPVYVFVGGLGGLSEALAEAAELTGRRGLARAARRTAAAAALAGPPLLVADLGVPGRFHHMLRVFKPTSPLSVGSWILAAFSPAAAAAAGLDEIGRLPGLRRLAQRVGSALGFGMATYTAVLFANTAVPVWHEARRELPFLFGGSAAASAGAAALLLAPEGEQEPARRLALAGAVIELGAEEVMERRLGSLAEPYHEGDAGRWAKLAKSCTAAGTALVAAGGANRLPLRRLGAVALLAGSFCQRWAVYRAGFQGTADPKYVVTTQRRRLAETGDASGDEQRAEHT